MDAPPVHYVTTSDGWSIAYSTVGDGTPLVYMPTPHNEVHEVWRYRNRFFSCLAERFELVQYDSRGQGLSGRGLKPGHNVDHYVLDLEAVVDTLKLQRFALWGHAFMVDVALRYAIRHPERVMCLVLQAVRLRGDDHVSTQLIDMATRDWTTFLNVTREAFTGREAPVDLATIQRQVTQQDWLARVEAFRGSDLSSLLPKVTAPVLLLAIDGESIDWPAHANEVMPLVPNGSLAILGAEDLRGRHAEVVHSFLSRLGMAPSVHRAADVLTDRELEVLRLLAAGRSNQQIADQLVISLNTVRRHVSNIFTKTGAANRADAASFAHRNGLISND